MNVRDTLLLACGSAESRSELHTIFEENYNMLEADNTHQAALLLEQNHSCISVILLDTTISEKIDPAMRKRIETLAITEEIPIIVLVPDINPDNINDAFDRGAIDVLPTNMDLFMLQHRVQTLVDLYRHKWHLEELVEEQADTLRQSNDIMVDALSSIIEYRSAESGQHILRIRRFTQILLEEVALNCPEYGLTETAISIISSASALHDIGKISIPDSILNKPGKLSAEEWAVMKGHALTGCRILETLGDLGNPEYLRYAHNICHYHHERWDGNGYPEGLMGDTIPICAQVVGLADAYDALTSKRVYKDAFSFQTANNMILNGECGVFSPKLLECFKAVADKFESLAKAYADGLSPNTEKIDVTLPAPQHRKGLDTLHNVQSKYQTLLHFINGTAVEVDVDQQLFHLIYNPNPELAPLSNISSFNDVAGFILNIVMPEEREDYLAFINEDIPHFLRSGMRKQIHYFHLGGRIDGQYDLYQITLLRSDFTENSNRFIIIWQKMSPAKDSSFHIQTAEKTISLPEEIRSVQIGRISFRNDNWFTLESMGEETAAVLGYSEEEIRSLHNSHLIELVMPEDRKLVRQLIHEQLEKHSDAELTYRIRQKNSPFLWLLLKTRLVTKEDGNEYLVGTVTDVHRSKMNQNRMQMDLKQYRALFANTQNVTFEWDLVNDNIIFSEHWYDIFGYEPKRRQALAELATDSHFHPDDITQIYSLIHHLQKGGQQQSIDVRIAKADGRYLWCRFQAVAVHDDDGNLVKILGLIVNIDDEKRAAKELQEKAERDSLTKLLNKNTARKQAEEYISSLAEGAPCALLLIDLDNFKSVNDNYGHMFGDTVLTSTAREIKKMFRSQDIIARIGGDEFMVLMRGISDPELVKNRCQRLLYSLQSMFRAQMPDCNVSCSIGIAMAPAHGKTYFDLFQRADQALYQVKDRGKNNFLFYNSKDISIRSRKTAVSAVNERIDSDEQPELMGSNIVQYTFNRLYESGDLESSLQDALALIGQQLNISRVYVFENTPDNKYCNNTFEWCSDGITPEIENLQMISYEEDIPTFQNNFNEQDVFYCSDISTLSKDLRDILEPQGIKSVLHCAIRDNGVFRGYVGFDDCRNKRLWTKDQVNLLTYFSQMLSALLLKKRAQDETSRYAGDLRSVLDSQNAWIYVIDPETCKLKFLNARTKELAPDVKVGMHCYKGIMGLEERCPECPAKNILQDKTAEQTMYNRQFRMRMLAEATLIQWENEDSCMLSCRKLKDEVF